MTVSLGFYGGVGTVTGSKFLVDAPGRRILVDCGLFHGFKPLRGRNWEPLPFEPVSLDAVVLTHAHLSHSGHLPILVRDGFRGPVYATSATRDLCEILLRDTGYLQERDAEYANRQGFSRHHPALPLFSEADAMAALERFVPVPFGEPWALDGGATLHFRPSGHLLGSASVALDVAGASLLFSGDLGRWNSATMLDPATVERADVLVVESTYGDRIHEPGDPEDRLVEIINRVVGRGGTILIPDFSAGRAQTMLFHLYRMKAEGRIPDVPVVVDSPRAINAGEIFGRHLADHRLTAAECRAACNLATYVRDDEASRALDSDPTPKLVMSASPMAMDGRVLHHLTHLAPDPRNAILFTGYQAGGTRGAKLIAGADAVKIHGRMVPVRAEVTNLHWLSSHADADEIMRWLDGFQEPPRRTFVVHGEGDAPAALRARIAEDLGWSCEIPEDGSVVELG